MLATTSLDMIVGTPLGESEIDANSTFRSRKPPSTKPTGTFVTQHVGNMKQERKTRFGIAVNYKDLSVD